MFFLNAGQYKKVVNLKQKNPKLKVSIAIGGKPENHWSEGYWVRPWVIGKPREGERSRKYSDMADKPENRNVFIESVLAFIK